MRWIFPGQLEAALARWSGRFPAATESREDIYLLDPPLPGLSVKVRGGGALEVKTYRESPGNPRGGGPRPRPSGVLAEVVLSVQPAHPPQRSGARFSLDSGQIVARAPRPGAEPQCEVELTEVHTNGQDWWTLGFEATGPADLLRSELQATAALVFAHAIPGEVQPSLDESQSYAHWLYSSPAADTDHAS